MFSAELLLLALTVVLPERPQPWERTAAEELKRFSTGIADAEGVTFRIADDASLDEDEWRVKGDCETVVLSGGGTHGTLYAVYHFLEDAAGVRFWEDEDIDVPENARIDFAMLDMRGKPAFGYRDIYRSGSCPGDTPAHAIRRRLNRNGDRHVPAEYGGEMDYGPPYHCHTFDLYIPWSQYKDAHPEYFSLIDGKRAGGRISGNLCLTNPDVRALLRKCFWEYVAEGDAAARAKGVVPPRIYDISMNDFPRFCECDWCRAEYEKYSESGVLLGVINEIAAEAAERRPGLMISTLLYHCTEPPPKGGVKPLDNVLVKLCDTRSNQALALDDPKDAKNRLFLDFIKSWSAIAPHMVVWDYAPVYCNYSAFMPFASEFTLRDTYRAMHQNNFFGIFLEHEQRDTADMFVMKYYLETRFMEDPYADSDVVIRDAFGHYFGAAGEFIYKARRRLYELAQEKAPFIHWEAKPDDFDFVPVKELEAMTALWDAAERAVSRDAKRLARVVRARRSHDQLVQFTLAKPKVSRDEVFSWGPEAFAPKPESPYAVVPDAKSPCGKALKVSLDRMVDFTFDPPLTCGIFDYPAGRTVDERKIAKPSSFDYEWFEFEGVSIPGHPNHFFCLGGAWGPKFRMYHKELLGRHGKLRVLLRREGAMQRYDDARPNAVYVAAVEFDAVSAQAVDSPFLFAKPVWPAAKLNETNVHVRFVADFAGGRKNVLRVTGADAYRVKLNGEFVHFGPARAARGFFRTDALELAAKQGANTLEIVAAGYNLDTTFQYASNPPFLQAEVEVDGRIAAFTAADCGGFAAHGTPRVQRASRYTTQRTFVEHYRLQGASRADEVLSLAETAPRYYLDRIAPLPDYSLNLGVRPFATCSVVLDGARYDRGWTFDEVPGGTEWAAWEELLRTRHPGRRPLDGNPLSPQSIVAGQGVMYDAGIDECGFTQMRVEVKKPGRLLFDFDEVLADDGDVVAGRMSACNHFAWDFAEPGTYDIETFEPYSWRYAVVSALDGAELVVSDLKIRRFRNAQAMKAEYSGKDPELKRIFDAAKTTFAHNAVDVFTDCPSRERGGWLCDSFFIGRMGRYYCGSCGLEKLYLQNFLVPKRFGELPAGMFPMCYPSGDKVTNFIPNWAMWLVLEVEEYLARSGDRAMVDAFKPKFLALKRYLDSFRNADGLLEKLPAWVFVEWSRCNSLVQDVNYPSNMTYAEVLSALGRMYGIPEFAADAERIRETVRKQSWTGKWFCDNAVRQPDGALKLSGECTETCQYYAFFFRTATPATHPRLWKTLVDDFGPSRHDAADHAKLLKHPEIWPSNAFIGNYLRLELLHRAGLREKILAETKGYFLRMADRTGTLWEHDVSHASCDHGFASHAAVYLMEGEK